MPPNAKVIVKETVFYKCGDSCERAPAGRYRLERRSDCIGFCKRSGASAFTLSLDSFIQHLNEGRIALV
ncbi:hypothetical protein [Hyphococcus sp.]|uniref:hypothetical protein n=1 Tax=Hyphococcus sp. TaxID=2038636 RepID=UPI003CCC0F62